MECLSSRRDERPLGGGRAKIENSSRPHPRKSGQKRFLAVRRSWRGNGVACFWATSLEKIFGGVIAIISFRPGGWMQQSTVPRCVILSVGSTGGIGQCDGASSSRCPAVWLLRGRLGTRAADGDAGDWVAPQRRAVRAPKQGWH